MKNTLDLAGMWQFAMDAENAGIKDKWYDKNLEDLIELPGTMDLRGKGIPNSHRTTDHLSRRFIYEGPAWYRKKITIPMEWKGQHIQLILERTRCSQIWVDDQWIGESTLLQSNQIFDLSCALTPGDHYLTLQINNDQKLTPYGNVHINSEDTQTNWNGILGNIQLEVFPKTYISQLEVLPDYDRAQVDIVLHLKNGLSIEELNLNIQLELINGKGSLPSSLERQRVILSLDSQQHCLQAHKFSLELGEFMESWDLTNQALYRITLSVENLTNPAELEAPRYWALFGMRKFESRGTQFALNNKSIFLRGKHDACVFPLTGYAPMDRGEWERIFKIAQSYGINHYRFHSWCPPEAAFEAADRCGMLLQPELPFWGGLDYDETADLLLQEGSALLKAFGNHPSFVMFGPGNEIWSGHERVDRIITALKKQDSRHLYCMGANDCIGYLMPLESSDFHLAARTPSDGDSHDTHIRLTHAFADSENGGILNSRLPSTDFSFENGVNSIAMPLVSHEIGQYQIYPDYTEIEKYSGVLRAGNLEIYKERLNNSGMGGMDKKFQKASGAWSAICYKAEMEAALRTRGFAGFQLLDLQDFPGQGTAMVGILDSFMDSKEVITPGEWKESCDDITLLLKFPKYCWQNHETFKAELVVANYSGQSITGPLNWEIRNTEDHIIAAQDILLDHVPNGDPSFVGSMEISLNSFTRAEKLKITLNYNAGEYRNHYPLWVYPEMADNLLESQNILITHRLDRKVQTQMEQGASVLLFPKHEDVEELSVGGLFPPCFWNHGMFKKICEAADRTVSPGTLGLLTDPDHPIFNEFPSDSHSNWQWFSIIKESRPLILDNTDKGYYPLVQVIDNLERNHKLGLIFEARQGKGKLLVCMSRLIDILDKPEARQLYQSILSYMNSENFKPSQELTGQCLAGLSCN